MRRMRVGALALVAMMVAAPLAAQGRGPARDARPDRRGPAGNPLERVLEHRAELGLSAAQVERLTEIRSRAEAEAAPIAERLEEARGDRDLRDLSREERAAFRQRMEALRPEMERLREIRRSAFDQASEVLTDAQKEKLRELMPRRRPGRRGGGGGR